jgi:hypothetical protein
MRVLYAEVAHALVIPSTGSAHERRQDLERA